MYSPPPPPPKQTRRRGDVGELRNGGGKAAGHTVATVARKTQTVQRPVEGGGGRIATLETSENSPPPPPPFFSLLRPNILHEVAEEGGRRRGMHCGGNRQWLHQELYLYFIVSLYIFENVWSLRILLRGKVHQRAMLLNFSPRTFGRMAEEIDGDEGVFAKSSSLASVATLPIYTGCKKTLF